MHLPDWSNPLQGPQRQGTHFAPRRPISRTQAGVSWGFPFNPLKINSPDPFARVGRFVSGAKRLGVATAPGAPGPCVAGGLDRRARAAGEAGRAMGSRRSAREEGRKRRAALGCSANFVGWW